MATIRDYSRRDGYVNDAIAIANNPSHGYSQANRWGNPDYDCSSLVYSVLYPYYPNLKKTNPRYTGTMVQDFSQIGFTVHNYDGNLNDLDIGDILLSDEHTCIYVGGGQVVEATSSENGGIYGAGGDQTGREIMVGPVYQNNWRFVLEPPADYIEIPDNPLGIRRGQLWDYHGGQNQKLSIVHNEDGTVSLIDLNYGLALDVNRGEANLGSPVNFNPYNGTNYQRWRLVQIPGVTYPENVAPFVLYNVQNPEMVLDADCNRNGENGTQLQLWAYYAGDNQIWYVEDNLKGAWSIRSLAWPNKVIDCGDLL